MTIVRYLYLYTDSYRYFKEKYSFHLLDVKISYHQLRQLRQLRGLRKWRKWRKWRNWWYASLIFFFFGEGLYWSYILIYLLFNSKMNEILLLLGYYCIPKCHSTNWWNGILANNSFQTLRILKSLRFLKKIWKYRYQSLYLRPNLYYFLNSILKVTTCHLFHVNGVMV